MNNNLLLVKNDFEGIASAILLSVLFKHRIDIKFYRYEVEHTELETAGYDYIYAIGIKNIDKIETSYKCLTVFEKFIELVEILKADREDLFIKYKQLNVFCEHALAYLDWTWQDNKIYYGKNIDELSKYFNKNELVRNIADKIINDKEIINAIERQMIIFSKKIMTNYIDKKNYYIVEKDGVKLAYAFSEMNEIELANKIIEKENVDAVVLANLNNRIIRIKANKKNKNFTDDILKLNGHANSNGGTLKISDETYDKVHCLVFDEILNTLKGGEINGR